MARTVEKENIKRDCTNSNRAKAAKKDRPAIGGIKPWRPRFLKKIKGVWKIFLRIKAKRASIPERKIKLFG